MTALLALAGTIIDGLAALLPLALSFMAGRESAAAKNLKRAERRRRAQLQIRRPGDRAVLDRLRRGAY